MRSNCLIYALLKLYRECGYITIRKSRFGWWPHFLHMSDEGAKRAGDEISHYAPKHKYSRWFPPLLFKGRVVTGDEE